MGTQNFPPNGLKGNSGWTIMCSLVAFDKECLHNAVEIENFEPYFWTTISPPPKNYSGAVTSLSFYQPRFKAYNNVENKNSSTVPSIERSRINCKVLATLPMEKTSPTTKRRTQF